MSLPDKNIQCPATGFAKSCRDIYIETEGGCPKYVHIRGVDSNTGKEIDRYGCVNSFIPMLLIENSNMQRQTGAAVESFRNEMVKGNAASARLLMAAAGRPLILENKK